MIPIWLLAGGALLLLGRKPSVSATDESVEGSDAETEAERDEVIARLASQVRAGELTAEQALATALQEDVFTQAPQTSEERLLAAILVADQERVEAETKPAKEA